MENGTSICKGLKDILEIKDVRERLEIVATLFEEKESCKINFCKIFGKRWSFFAGTGEILVPEKRMQINEEYGLIIENNTLLESTWEALKKCFQKIIEPDS